MKRKTNLFKMLALILMLVTALSMFAACDEGEEQNNGGNESSANTTDELVDVTEESSGETNNDDSGSVAEITDEPTNVTEDPVEETKVDIVNSYVQDIMKYFEIDESFYEGEYKYFYDEDGRYVKYGENYYPNGAVKRRVDYRPYDVLYTKNTFYKENGEIIKILEQEIISYGESVSTLKSIVYDAQETLIMYEYSTHIMIDHHISGNKVLGDKLESLYYDSEEKLIISIKYEYDDKGELIKATVYDADGNIIEE